jgi:hypothetical protein
MQKTNLFRALFASLNPVFSVAEFSVFIRVYLRLSAANKGLVVT